MLVANRFRCLRTLLVSIAWAVAPWSRPTQADSPQNQPATRPATTQAASRPSNPAANQKAHQIIDAALAKYRAAKSYADKLSATSEIVAKDKDGQDAGQSSETALTLAWAQPNRLAVIADDFAICSSGKQLWLYTAALDQYTEGPAPEKLDYDRLTEAIGADTVPHPVLYVLTHPEQKFETLFPMIREFTAVIPEERDGRPGSRLAGVFDAAQTRFEIGPELVPFSLWFDATTGLLGEIRIDLTALIRKELELPEDGTSRPAEESLPPGVPQRVDRARATVSLSDVRLDADIPADRFVFKPEPGAQKVDKFDFEEPMAMPDPQKLVGQPAPTFTGTGLDQKPLALESLQGRVVVLDFWATWCIPCVQSMPKIQKIAEKFADQPVTVVGINQDSRGKDQAVKQFLKDKKITFRQFLDPTGKLGRKFKVSGIPCTFLLDKKGIVQAVHVGLAPDGEEVMTKEIETLLKGQNIEKKQP
jgi:thiol-disulfide isomerase/thioredoxin/outer membrane lipoprotein-sorting protein